MHRLSETLPNDTEVLVNGTDANTILETGHYKCMNLVNSPIPDCYLIVIDDGTGVNDTAAMQIVYDNKQMAHRSTNSATWSITTTNNSVSSVLKSANGIEGFFASVADNADGNATSRIMLNEVGSTSIGNYGLSLNYSGAESGSTCPVTGWLNTESNAVWDLRGHDNSLDGIKIMSGLRSSADVTFYGTVSATAFNGNASTATWADTVDVNTSTDTGYYNICWASGDVLFRANASAEFKYRPSDGHVLIDHATIGNYLNVFTDGRISVNNTNARRAGMYGNYDSYKVGHIWSMSPSYLIPNDGSNFGSLYGFAYKHTNNATGGSMGGGHMAVWCQNGTPYVSLGTNIWAKNNITAYSDARVKTNLEVIPNALDKVNAISGYTYNRIDIDDSEERHAGVIAQEVLEVLPEVVTGGPTENDPDNHYSVAYGNLTALLIEAVKELKQRVEELEAK